MKLCNHEGKNFFQEDNGKTLVTTSSCHVCGITLKEYIKLIETQNKMLHSALDTLRKYVYYTDVRREIVFEEIIND